jgi:hypothetical protein
VKIKQSLLKHGFKLHPVIKGSESLYKNADEFAQLKVWDELGEKALYFVNCYLYSFKDAYKCPDSLKEDLQASFEVQFSFGEDEFFNVGYSTQNVEEALQFFKKMYTVMNCTAYDD